MKAAKKTNSKENPNSIINNVNSDTVTKNDINFENISAANEQACENVNILLDQIGNFGLNYIGFVSNLVSGAIRSSQALTDITSEFVDEIYKSGANNLKESLTCTSFSQIVDLVESTINKQVDTATRYSNDIISFYSLNFNKLFNGI